MSSSRSATAAWKKNGRALHRRRGRANTQGRTGIDVVIGAHSHTELHEAIIVNDRTPVVQTGKYGQNLGELVITLDGNKLTVGSYKLYPIDDTIVGDEAIADEIDKFKKTVTEVVFASRGYRIDQPLAVVPRDIPNTYTDIAVGTILANFCTDAFRKCHQSGYRLHRQRNDAVRLHPGESRAPDCVQRIRRGAARRWCGGPYARKYAHDGLLYRPGIEASA